MVLRQHRRTFAVALALAALCSAPAQARQKNTVVGTVHTIEGEPLGDVTVILAQVNTVKDKTKHADGVYALDVPGVLRKFDLIFEHPNYLKAFDRRIENRNPPIKRNVVVLTPKSPKAVAALPEQDLERIIRDSLEVAREVGVLTPPPLARAGRENLEYLEEVARLFAQEGKVYVLGRRDEMARAVSSVPERAREVELLLKQALVIQERILAPSEGELAETLHLYADVLSVTGQHAEAEKYYRRAYGIRERIDMRPARRRPE